MNVVLEEIFATHQVISPEGGSIELTDAVNLNEGLFLTDIVREFQPKLSLEIGMAYGISTLFICDALAMQPTAHHIVIDPFQFKPGPWGDSWQGVGMNNLQRAGYSALVELREELSSLALPELVRQGVMVDFAFIDGWHTFDYVLNDFFYVDQLLPVGGHVAFDDAQWRSVQKALRFILTNKAYKITHQLGNPIPSITSKQKAILTASQMLPSLSRVLKPEYTQPSTELGIGASRCVVLSKYAPDTRAWDFHREF